MVVDDKKLTQRTYPTFAEGYPLKRVLSSQNKAHFLLYHRYKLLECVGRGSEGSVWRALCIPIKKDVAIKIIDLECMPTAALEELRVSLI
jgi:hypothetical protein